MLSPLSAASSPPTSPGSYIQWDEQLHPLLSLDNFPDTSIPHADPDVAPASPPRVPQIATSPQPHTAPHHSPSDCPESPLPSFNTRLVQASESVVSAFNVNLVPESLSFLLSELAWVAQYSFMVCSNGNETFTDNLTALFKPLCTAMVGEEYNAFVSLSPLRISFLVTLPFSVNLRTFLIPYQLTFASFEQPAQSLNLQFPKMRVVPFGFHPKELCDCANRYFIPIEYFNTAAKVHERSQLKAILVTALRNAHTAHFSNADFDIHFLAELGCILRNIESHTHLNFMEVLRSSGHFSETTLEWIATQLVSSNPRINQ